MPLSEVVFGGPDQPPRILRDLLEQKIRAVPPGGWIQWATYYLRDRALAEALIEASDRGVRVRLHLERRPRNARVNRPVLEMLGRHGLNGGLLLHDSGLPNVVRPYLHAKIYAFSHPFPSVLIGSFNPSGDVPEDPEVIADIGDQDRGHNVLVEYKEPLLVRSLCEYMAGIGGLLDRFQSPRSVAEGPTTIWFYPRIDSGIIERELASLGADARVRAIVSHLKMGSAAQGLAAAAKRGASVRLIVHDTSRRVPDATFAMLAGAGVAIDRYAHPQDYPLHAKILLVETASTRRAWFGSLNYNRRSRFLNHEILVQTSDPGFYDRFAARLDAVETELAAQAPAAGGLSSGSEAL